ncbi:MAG: hypothetical protein ACOY4T_03890 [Pseudomonadota bacterium]
MEFDAESLEKQIPFYLTADDQQVLVRELKAIAGGGAADYLLGEYRDSFKDVMLQGDGWRGFQLFIFESGERRSVRGVVLSNSCDVDPENPRDVPARVIFAPLVKLSAYEALLASSGIDEVKVRAKIASIRAQKTTNVFFLPASGPLAEDYVVRLDEAHSMPVAAHVGSADREKLFTLSNTGFYMLVLKLSVHFCRLQEKVNRKPAEAA